MLLQKQTIRFSNFNKGWIPETEVYPGASVPDSALDIINFDIDAIKGGITKTNGLKNDTTEYSSYLSSALTNPNPLTNSEIKYIGNYSLGSPKITDLLLVVAYHSQTNPKYKWLLRDMLLNNNLISENGYERYYNLLLKFTAQVNSIVTNNDFTTIGLNNFSSEAFEILDDNNLMIPGSLDGFIVNFGTEQNPIYRVVVKTEETYIIVTPSITVSQGTTLTFYRSRLSIDPDYNSIFNPSKEYLSFTTNNYGNRLLIGLGKEVKPLWLGYINRHYFYNKSANKYLLDYNGETFQKNIILEKRIPEFDMEYEIKYFQFDGKVKQNTPIELCFTATFDGFQDVLPNNTKVNSPSQNISIGMYIKNNGYNVMWRQQNSPVPFILQSNFYIKLNKGNTNYCEIRFIEDDDWENFVSQIDLQSNPDKIWVKCTNTNKINDIKENINEFALGIYAAIAQIEPLREVLYVGSHSFSDINVKLIDKEYPYIVIESNSAFAYSTGMEWKVLTNARYGGNIEFNCESFTYDNNYDDEFVFYNGTNAAVETYSNIFEIKLPLDFNTIQIIPKIDISKFNRRITSINVWGRYKPNIENVSKWLIPFYQLAKIYINDTNEKDDNNNVGWYWNTDKLSYDIYIKKIYGKEIEDLGDSTEISDEIAKEVERLKDIPQLLPTIVYEPTIKNSCKYSVSTIKDNISYVAGTDDNEEVLRFSRKGYVNNIDLFPYDYNAMIGYEVVGTDSPGYITALTVLNDELIVLKNNSFFSLHTDASGIMVAKCSNFVGCHYYRSVVSTKYGVIFADNKGIWLYQGKLQPVIQINWQWSNYYLNTISEQDKKGMFAVWNGETEEYWLYIGGIFYICDFKNYQSIDSSMEVMKQKEKIIFPWRKKKFNDTMVAMAYNSNGKVIVASTSKIYFNDNTIFSFNDQKYNDLYIETKIISTTSPKAIFQEIFTESEKEIKSVDWKIKAKLYVDGFPTPRQEIILQGNYDYKDLVCVRPINIGSVNDLKIRIDVSDDNGTTVKKIRAFGINLIMRQPKYVTE